VRSMIVDCADIMGKMAIDDIRVLCYYIE
jgi:hypothetical protein